VAVGDEARVDARLEGGAVTHEVEAEARQLALGAHPRGRQPDGRHEVAARELGQHVGVDAVGLGGERRETLDLAGIGERDRPALLLERVVHEARPVHRLEGGVDRLAARGEPRRQAAQPVSVGWDGGDGRPRTRVIEHTHVQALP
jgi:hypothetical protein